jgi:thiamine kinase-like enzyme
MDFQAARKESITSVEDVTKEWLSSILSIPIESFTSNRIGTGQVSWTYRLILTSSDSAAPSSVILKVSSSDPDSRSAGLSLGIYEKEVCFYQDIAPALAKLGSLAVCYHASWDSQNGTFALLLGDAKCETGDDIIGATIEQARVAVTELGKIHGNVLRNDSLLDKEWLNKKRQVNQTFMEALFAGFVERYKDRLKPEHLNVCRRFVSSFDAWQEQQKKTNDRNGLVHGDYRLDNLLFGKNGELTVVDWQTLFVGPVMADFAYFIGSSLKINDRRKYQDELLKLYIESLGEGTGMTEDAVKNSVKGQTFFGIVMCIASPMLVERTERGDEMFMVMMERHCTAVLDLHALELLPKAEVQAPIQPNPEDEHPHAPGKEELWNESWYFDLIDENSGVGVYVRLGRYPNLKGSWYTAVITHPKRGLLAVTDYECPHPEDDLTVISERFRAEQHIIIPLQEYQVTLEGGAEEFIDPADVLRAKKGKDTQIKMNIIWKTDGIPYAWRMTTRYEIPCRATGTVVIDGEEIAFKDALAQRDHSHGVRDWVSPITR